MQAVLALYLGFAMVAMVVALLNVLVRRPDPPLTTNPMFALLLTTAPRVMAFYMFMLSITYFLV